MRHLGSFALALVLAPAVFLLTGVGLDAFAAASAKGPQAAPVDTALALAALAVAGGVYAVLVMARLSPVGPAFAGLLLLGVSAWPMVDADGYRIALADFMGLFSDTVEIRGFNLVGLSGLGVFLAIPLLATVASPRRWSQYEFPIAEVEPARYSGGTPDATRYLPAQTTEPVTTGLPDIKAPSLGYPKAAGAQVTPQPAAPQPVAPQPLVAPPVVAPPVPTAEPPVIGEDKTVSLINGDPDETRQL